MKEGEGKAVRKSDKITGTPARPITAAVTPKASEREQGNTKKSRQIRKQQLEKYFGQGPRVTAPSKEGTPIDAVLQRRERGPDHDEGKRRETTSLSDKATKMTKPKKQQQTVDTREVQEAKKRAA
jgi:hypothetical protein